jgi:xanthine/CO dehydrogenase XdhC/CoxF family maturation factor
MRREILEALNVERAARRAAVLVTDLESGAQRLVRAAEIERDPLADILSERLRLGRSARIEADGRSLFVLVQIPRRRLVVVGAVHVSQALAPMAKLAEIEMTIVDPRTAFATPERFPDVDVIAELPQIALPQIGLDAFTGLAALSHVAEAASASRARPLIVVTGPQSPKNETVLAGLDVKLIANDDPNAGLSRSAWRLCRRPAPARLFSSPTCHASRRRSSIA